jgi:hypothetical protein
VLLSRGDGRPRSAPRQPLHVTITT